MTPRVSFIIPVKNDAVRLGHCLRTITARVPAGVAAEILVIDNGSRDASPEVARAAGARVLVDEAGRVSELRNLGAQQATAGILAFVDADNEIVDGWVEALLDILNEPAVTAAGAVYMAPPRGTWVQHAYGLLRGRTRRQSQVDWLGSGNLAVRRTAFLDVGGFDASLEACEDVDFCARLRDAGHRLVGDPRLASIHHGDPSTLRALFKSELWRGRDNLRVSLRRPVAWRSLPSAFIPVIDLAMLTVAALGLGAMLLGSRPAGLIAAAALLIILAGAGVKVLRARLQAPGESLLAVLQAVVVASVYDLARALALVARAPHRNVHTAERAAAS